MHATLRYYSSEVVFIILFTSYYVVVYAIEKYIFCGSFIYMSMYFNDVD